MTARSVIDGVGSKQLPKGLRTPQPGGGGERRFVVAFGLVVALLIGSIAGFGARLVALGELGGSASRPGELYGTWFASGWPDYKLEQAIALQPDIVVLGSSRVLQVRAEMFEGCRTRPACFFNAGGAMLTTGTGVQFERRLERHRPPRLLLLGFDFWQFSPAWDATTESFGFHDGLIERIGYSLDVSRELLPTMVSDPAIRDVVVGRTNVPAGRQGLQAAIQDAGFRADGSYAYPPANEARILASSARDLDRGDLDDLARRCCFFTPFAAPDPVALGTLETLVASAKAAGTSVVAFIPPLSDGVATSIDADPVLQTGIANTESALRELLARLGVPFLAFRRMSDAGCDDRERWDGHHPSEVCLGRVLLRLADGPAQHELAPYVRREAIAALIAGSPTPLRLGPAR